MPTLPEGYDDRAITPSLQVIHYMRRQSFTMLKVLKELVDNAIDAVATRILLEVSRARIAITDNGHGCANLREC